MEGVDLKKRCPTGIKGFDDLIAGGFPRGRTILVAGQCGTGKTILATQFVYNGATKYNEPGIIVLLEQGPEEFKEDMKVFNMDLSALEKSGKLILIDASLSKLGMGDVLSGASAGGFSLMPGETNLENLIDVVLKVAEKVNAKRVVVDSLPALDLMSENKHDVRKMILNINYRLKSAGLTSVLISDLSDEVKEETEGVERYVVDGVVSLYYTTVGPDAGRTLVIDKMRRTSHSEDIHTLKFVEGYGLEVVHE